MKAALAEFESRNPQLPNSKNQKGFENFEAAANGRTKRGKVLIEKNYENSKF